MQRLVICLLMLVSFGASPVVSPLNAAAKMRVEPVVVITASGRHSFMAEIADSPDLRSRGLMHRTQMAPDRGMLFNMGSDAEIHMWMKNTLIGLDMIFITKQGIVAKIAKNTVPHSEAIISSNVSVRGVFEVIAGTADRINLKPGDRIEHPLFR